MSRYTVTLITQIFPPESNAGANRAAATAARLSQIADLRVVTLLPSYPSPEYHQKRGTLEGHDQKLPYVVERAGNFHPHRGHFVIRALRESLMAIRIAWRAGRSRSDVLVATCPSIFVGLAAAIVSRVKRAPLVIDLRDVTWDYVSNEARQRNSKTLKILARILRSSARFVLRRANLVSVTNEGIKDSVAALGIDPERIINVPNGVSTELLNKGLALREPERSPDRYVVTYAGALGYYQSIGILIDVATLMPEVEFRIVGDGPQRETLETRVRQEQLSNVLLTGYVDRETLYGHYEESHILFAQLRDLPVLAATTLPSKTFEFMATGRAIVYASTSALLSV